MMAEGLVEYDMKTILVSLDCDGFYIDSLQLWHFLN